MSAIRRVPCATDVGRDSNEPRPCGYRHHHGFVDLMVQEGAKAYDRDDEVGKQLGFHVLGRHLNRNISNGQPGEPCRGSGRDAAQQDGHDAVLQPQPTFGETCSAGKSAPALGSPKNAGTNAGAGNDSVRTQVGQELACYDEFTAIQWALNSAVECHLHTVEVIGSNPIAPTIFSMA